MGLVKEKSNWYYLFFLVLVSSVIRVLVPFYRLFIPNIDKRYLFRGTNTPFFLKFDSYYYVQILEGFGFSRAFLFWSTLVFSVAVVVLFYLLLRRLGQGKVVCFVASLTLSVFPYFYGQSLLGYVDTPLVIFVCFSLMVLCCVEFLLWSSVDRVLVFAVVFVWCFWLLDFVWGVGVWLLVLFCFVGLCFGLFRSNWLSFLLGTISLCIVALFYKSFLALLSLRTHNIAEYVTPRWIPYYFLFFLSLVIFYQLAERNDKLVKFFFGGYIAVFLLSVCLQRFAAFSMFFFLPFLLLSLDQLKLSDVFKRNILLLLFILFFVQVRGEFSRYEFSMNSEYEALLYELPEEGSILNFWDEGHIVDYFTTLYVPYKAHPYPGGSTNFSMGITLPEVEGIKILDEINASPNYFLLITPKTLNKTLFLGYELERDSLLYKSEHGHTSRFFYVFNEKFYKGRSYILYKRK